MGKIACSFGTYFLLRFQLVYSLGIAERNVVSSYRVTETRVFGSLHVFRVPKDNYNKCAKKKVQILCTMKSYSTTDCLLVGTDPSKNSVGEFWIQIHFDKGFLSLSLVSPKFIGARFAQPHGTNIYIYVSD